MPEDQPTFASRGGFKLAAAVKHFNINVAGLVCADLGCSVGGFVDCLLQRGAARVYAVDTAYGQLAWKLRQDGRVTVLERTNALYVDPAEPCDLVTIDLGWTRQAKALPVAMRWLKPGGRIITLVKPHYEQPRTTARPKRAKGRALDPAEAERVLRNVLQQMPGFGVQVLDWIISPIVGSKGGNIEYLVLVEPLEAVPTP